jgi:DNA-binding transcriptional ArsR family regulator
LQTSELKALESNARRASVLLKAMGNPHRLMILCQLVKGEKCVSELERIVGLSQSALSQHLAKLRQLKLVQTRRQAQTIYYGLAGGEAAAVIETLYRLYCADTAASLENPPAEEVEAVGAP